MLDGIEMRKSDKSNRIINSEVGNAYIKAFDHLQSKLKINGKNISEHVENLKRSQIEEIIGEIIETFPGSLTLPTKNRTLFANTELSGGGHPCMYYECRSHALDHTLRMASLYADYMIVQNPFSRLIHSLPNDDNDLNAEFLTSLILLLEMKPVMEAGIILLEEASLMLCLDCHKELFSDSKLGVKSTYESLESILLQKVLDEVQFYAERDKEIESIILQGDTGLLEHSTLSIWFRDGLPPDLRPDLNNTKSRLSREQIEYHKLHEFITLPIADDIINNAISSKINNSRYVTSRIFDINLISELLEEDVRKRDKAISSIFSHNIPLYDNLPIEHILLERKREPESFNVYRNKFESAINELSSSDTDDYLDVFNDILQPEIDRLNIHVKTSKVRLAKEFGVNVGTALAFVGIGIFTGFITPALGAAITAIGGYNFLKEVGQGSVDLLGTPDDVKEDDYYFLWKIQKNN